MYVCVFFFFMRTSELVNDDHTCCDNKETNIVNDDHIIGLKSITKYCKMMATCGLRIN